MELRAFIEVDLSAIATNIARLKERAATPLMAVVKADAYGHGLIPVANVALEAGASWLGVALLEEALELRRSGITAPILAWLVPPGSEYEQAIEQGIDLAISSLEIFHEVSHAALRVGKRARVHIEVDTGMTRGGFLDEWNSFLVELSAPHEELEFVGFFSHFARADESGQVQNIAQLKRFIEMSDDLNQIGIEPEIHHLANSAATLLDAAAHFDLVRSGIAIYGLTPDLEHMGPAEKLDLKPAMRVRAKIHLVKEVLAGTPVGYGGVAKTMHDTKVAVIAMGYADGIPRISEGAGIWRDGQRAPLIGRVSMDQFVVDLGPNSDAKAGEWVTIFGAGDSGEYTADDWALASGTINYEIVAGMSHRLPRIYLPGNS